MYEYNNQLYTNSINSDIQKLNVDDLNKYLMQLEVQRKQLLDQQNNYLSQIFN